MTDDDMELIHGSGNIFRDLGRPNPDLKQIRVILAAEIIKTLDKRQLSVAAAQEATGIPAADFSQIRGAKLSRFTIDRLMIILDRLDFDVDVTIKPKRSAEAA